MFRRVLEYQHPMASLVRIVLSLNASALFAWLVGLVRGQQAVNLVTCTLALTFPDAIDWIKNVALQKQFDVAIPKIPKDLPKGQLCLRRHELRKSWTVLCHCSRLEHNPARMEVPGQILILPITFSLKMVQ